MRSVVDRNVAMRRIPVILTPVHIDAVNVILTDYKNCCQSFPRVTSDLHEMRYIRDTHMWCFVSAGFIEIRAEKTAFFRA
jgi:hypothetical protein